MIIFYIGVQNQLSNIELAYFFLLIFALFSCVVLHEFGHALTAKYYNVRTRDIIISPIGGVARLEKLPKKPKEELFIAIAGPLVNVIIASICLALLLLLAVKNPLQLDIEAVRVDNPIKFLKTLFVINIILFLFNLIPAFPMDGGRILRALLSFNFGRKKSTKIASTIGKLFAIFFMIFGLYISHFVLAIIGGFIFFMATSEYKQVALEDLLNTTRVTEIMRTSFTKISSVDQLSRAIDISSNTTENNFIVYNEDDKIVGNLPKLFIKDAIHKNAQHSLVERAISPKVRLLSPDSTVMEVRNILHKEGLAIALVGVNMENILGVIDRDAVINFMTESS